MNVGIWLVSVLPNFYLCSLVLINLGLLFVFVMLVWLVWCLGICVFCLFFDLSIEMVCFVCINSSRFR